MDELTEKMNRLAGDLVRVLDDIKRSFPDLRMDFENGAPKPEPINPEALMEHPLKKPIHLILCGPMCSGKSTLARYLNKEYHLAWPTVVTTRPRRSDDREYVFVTDSEFEKLDRTGLFNYVERYFVKEKRWDDTIEDCLVRYGFNWEIFASDIPSVSIMSYKQLDAFLSEAARRSIDFSHIMPVFLHAMEDICRERAISRGDEPAEVDRRLATDRSNLAKFQAMADCDFVVSTTDFSVEQAAKMIMERFAN